MKIVIEVSPTTSVSTMRGWRNTLVTLGHSVIFYEAKATPIFDIFDEHNPDIFISTVNDVSRGMAKVLRENPMTIVIFYSPAYGRISGENIEYVKELKEDTGKPNLIFSFGELNTINGWANEGFQTISLPKAADNIFYTPQPYQASWASDIAFVGNYSSELDEYIAPLCNQTKWTFRIFGGGDWPVANYIGNVQPENIKNIFSSSRIVLDLGDEPTDIPFNVLACDGTCFSNTYSDFPGKNELGYYPIWMFKNPDEMITLIRNFIEVFNTDCRGKFSGATPYIIEGHKYLDRVKNLLKSVGLEDEIHENC